MLLKSMNFNLYFLLYLFMPFLFWDGFGVFELNFFAVGTYLLCSFAIAQLCTSRIVSPVSCSFWIFVYIFIIISGVSQQVVGFFPWPSNYDDSYFFYSWILIFFCNVSFYIGSTNFSDKVQPYENYKFSKKLMNYFIPFSVLVTLLALNEIGNFSNLFLSRDEFSDIFEEDITSSMVVQALFRIPFFVVSIYFLQNSLSSTSKKSKIKNSLFFFVFFSLTVIINNPLSTPRFWVACIFITYALILCYHFKLNVNRLYINTLVFLTIFVFPVSDVFRRSLDVSIVDYFSETNISEGFIYSPNYDSFQQVLNSFVYVENNEHSYGTRTLSTIFFWIPRSFLPSKQNSSGEDIANFFRYDYTNLSAPLWAEMYLDFGFLGAIIAFSMFGYLVRKLDKSLALKSNVVVFFIAAYGIYFLRGTLLSVIGFLAVTLFLFFILRERKVN